MPVFANQEQLYTSMRLLFDRLQTQDSGSTQALLASRLVIRLRCTSPALEINIHGRQRPVKITYAPSSLRPDLDVELTADALHAILMSELPLKKALASGQMKVRGPVLKIFALEEILHRGQALYPHIVREQGLNGSSPAGA